DMATPFFATEYTVNHLGLHHSLRANVSLRYYESGHMMYIREADHAQLRRDIASFLAGL
ncbi:MAG: peptidase S10, partial [bacterium]|nr:peptidase S10 [bacterium]